MRTIRHIVLITSVVIMTFAYPFSTQSQSINALSQITRGNDFYQKKLYSKALEEYLGLIEQGMENGFLFYNIGNTYFRLERLGPAIYFYHKAKEFLPRDERVDANLRHAILETQDKILSPPKPLLHEIFFWLEGLSLNECLTALILVNAIFWITWLSRIAFPNKNLNALWKGILFLLLSILASTMAEYYSSTKYPIGVIMEKRLEVKASPGQHEVTLFELHEGTALTLEEESSDWYKIKIKDQKTGWVSKEGVRPL